MKRLGYKPALDGLRGLAILGVLFRHAFHVPLGGGFGVDLFFVLSGFLITTLLLEERERTGRISFREFYRRRALRLLPALVTMLLAFVVVDLARAALERRSDVLVDGMRALGLSAFYTANFVAAFHRSALSHLPIGQLWSLAEEEQFYLLWPLALIVLLRGGLRRRGVMAVLWILIGAVVVERFALTATHASPDRLYYGPDTHSDGLLLGCLVASWLRKPSRLALDRTLGFAALAVLAAVAYDPFFEFAVVAVVVTMASAALVTTVVAQPDGLVARAASIRPLVLIGRISYGLYLWQGLTLWTVGPAHRWLGVFLAFVMAGLSYRYVEQPFLRRKRRRAERTPATSSPPDAAPAPATALAVEA
jgi:peptidoglycan/LPS O-acetylase OafA/YrhL